MTCHAQVALAHEGDPRAVEQAKAAQPKWLKGRARVLMKISELISKLKHLLANCSRAGTRQAPFGREGVFNVASKSELAGRTAHLIRRAYSESAGAEHAG
jgi:hypothetical protein